MSRRLKERLVRARTASARYTATALRLYIDRLRPLGLIRLPDGPACGRPWLGGRPPALVVPPFVFRDCESDPAFRGG